MNRLEEKRKHSRRAGILKEPKHLGSIGLGVFTALLILRVSPKAGAQKQALQSGWALVERSLNQGQTPVPQLHPFITFAPVPLLCNKRVKSNTFPAISMGLPLF